MKLPVITRLTAIGAVLLGFALNSDALSLGRARGAVLVGRPLDLTVQLTLDAQEDPGNLCLEADVLYADTRIDASKVRISVDSSGGPQAAVIRVSAASIVDEPVVTVFLRAGCLQKVSRRYVMLPEVVVDATTQTAVQEPSVSAQAAPDNSLAGSLVPRAVAAPAALANGGAASTGAAAAAPTAQRPARAASSAAGAGAASAGPDAAAAAPRPNAAERRRLRAAAAEAAAQTAPAKAAEPVKTPKLVEGGKLSTRISAAQPAQDRKTRSRLKLEPLDLSVERDPTLRASAELLTAPAADETQRSAAAALWRSLTAQPQDILRDAERLKTLERDLRVAREAAGKSDARVTDLTTQLHQAEGERYANWLVYTLAALLLALAGAAAYFWNRTRDRVSTTRDWWRALDRSGNDEYDEELENLAPQPKSRRKESAKSKAAAAAAAAALDVDLDVDESMFSDLKSHAPKQDAKPSVALSDSLPPMDRVDFASSMPGIPRAVNAEELFDIQQQADFFVSLGQYDQAIEVLKTHISDNVETSALAYLDLFKIYHLLKRRDEFDALREDFNKVFNAEVPTFENFSEHSNGLESYQTALSRIEALWPSSKVLDIIEESIFRKPGGAGEAFDLEAYRELLLLYAMAKDVVERKPDLMGFELPDSQPPVDSNQEAGGSGQRFLSTSIQPLSAEVEPEPDSALDEPMMDMLPHIDMPKASARLGIDIDLTDPSSPEPSSPAPLPPVAFGATEPAGVEISGGPAKPDAATEPNSQMIDFDMFDSDLEFEISKKPNKN